VGLLRKIKNPLDFYDLVQEKNYIQKDQWMVQELVNGLHHCELLYYSEGLTNDDLTDFLVTPIDSVEEGIEQALQRHGSRAKILVIPEGPYVMPMPPTPLKEMYSWQTNQAAV